MEKRYFSKKTLVEDLRNAALTFPSMQVSFIRVTVNGLRGGKTSAVATVMTEEKIRKYISTLEMGDKKEKRRASCFRLALAEVKLNGFASFYYGRKTYVLCRFSEDNILLALFNIKIRILSEGEAEDMRVLMEVI